MRLCIALVLIFGLAGVAGAASLTTNVGKVKGTLSPILCSEPCRPGDINENEPVCYDGYYDYTNGGCNTQGWTELGSYWPDGVAHACGTAGTYYYGYYSYRDTDWFRTSTGSAGATTETVTAEFAPMLILIYANSGQISCSNYTYVYTFGTACVTSNVTAYIPAAGAEFWPWVGTQVFGYGVPCGSRYILDVNNMGGGGGDPFVTCCFLDGTCGTIVFWHCDGEIMPPGTPCDPNPCQATQTEHTTWGSVKSQFH